MAGQYLSSPIRITRSPFSRTESQLDCEPTLLRHPSRSSFDSTTLCDSQRRPHSILDIQSDAPLTPTTIDSRRTRHSDRALSPYARRGSFSPSPTSGSPSLLFTPLSQLSGPSTASPRSAKMSRPAADRPHIPTSSAGDASALKLPDNAAGGLGLMLGTMLHDVPIATFSSRLRRLAPPPLQLTPPESPVEQAHPRTPEPEPEAPLPSAATFIGRFPQRPHFAPEVALRSATTFLEFPGDQPNTPLSPLNARLTGIRTASLSAQAGSRNTSQSQGVPEEPPAYSRSPNTPRTPGAAPPPLPRTHCMSLPRVPSEYQAPVHAASLLSPLGVNLREALTVDNLISRADRCKEAMHDASFSLCSCPLLKDSHAIFDVCKGTEWAIAAVQDELDRTPEDRELDTSDELQHWFQRHWQIVSSVERNLNLFFLFADQLRQNPPRIHRLAGHVDKLHAYHAKFTDLARRLTVSHEKLHMLKLHTRVLAAHRTARMQADAERARRHDFRAAWREGRAQRQAVREEVRRSRTVTHDLRMGQMKSLNERGGDHARDFLEDARL